MGLAPITPDVDRSISASVRGLVCVDAAPFLTPIKPDGDRVAFKIQPDKGIPPETLAQALRGPGITEAHVENGLIVASLKPGAQPPPMPFTCLDLGPYRQASYAPDRLVLARRSGRGMETIEIRDVGSEEEEWRRFLAREVDVVPEVRRSLIENLSDVPSVRLVGLERNPYTGLVFRVDHGPFSDIRLRQVVSYGLRRRAIARAISGDESAATAVKEDLGEASRLLAEIGNAPPILVSFAATSTEDHRAAMVIEQQLLELGLRVKLDPEPLEIAADRVGKGDFEVFLMSAGYTPAYYWRVQTGSVANVSAYSNAELDQAIERGDHETAIAIMSRDLPMTPLFVQRNVIAVDRRLCGVHPKNSSDMSWLADVHLCAQGETE